MTALAQVPFLPATNGRDFRHAFWHDSLIDYILANPGAKLADLALFANRSEAWISTVRNSDSFRARYEQRRQELNRELGEGIHRKLAQAAGTALDILNTKLDDVKATGVGMKVGEVVSTADSLLTKLGYGVKERPATSVAVNVQTNNSSPVSAEAFAEARAQLRAQEAAKLNAPHAPQPAPQLTIEATVLPPSPEEG